MRVYVSGNPGWILYRLVQNTMERKIISARTFRMRKYVQRIFDNIIYRVLPIFLLNVLNNLLHLTCDKSR